MLAEEKCAVKSNGCEYLGIYQILKQFPRKKMKFWNNRGSDWAPPPSPLRPSPNPPITNVDINASIRLSFHTVKKGFALFVTVSLETCTAKSHNNAVYLNRQVSANNVKSDQTLRFMATGLILHCLTLIQQFYDTSTGNKLDMCKF